MPPTLLYDVAERFNRSAAKFLIMYHRTNDVIGKYNFQVELIDQFPTSMDSSGSRHTCYIYTRKGDAADLDVHQDFASAINLCKSDFVQHKETLSREQDEFQQNYHEPRQRRPPVRYTAQS